MRMWLAMLACAAVLTGCGIFFALQNLGKADQYASVASFFLALLSAAVSVLSLARSRPKDQNDSGTEESQHDRRGTTVNFAWDNEIVQQGPGAVANISKTVEPRPGKKARRNH